MELNPNQATRSMPEFGFKCINANGMISKHLALDTPEAFNFIQLYEHPMSLETELFYSGIPDGTLSQIGTCTGQQHPYGYIIRFGPGARMEAPILVEDKCFLVALRCSLSIQSWFEDGNETPTLLLEPEQGVYIEAGKLIRIGNQDRGEGQIGFIAWLEMAAAPAPISTDSVVDSSQNLIESNDDLEEGNRVPELASSSEPRTAQADTSDLTPSSTDCTPKRKRVKRRHRDYTRDEREHAVFLLDMGWSPSKVAADVGVPCTPSTVRLWQKEARRNDGPRKQLERMFDDLEDEN